MKRKLGTAILIMVTVVIVTIWIRSNVTRNGVKLKDYNKTDIHAREVADNFMKQLLGNEEFTKNYVYDPDSSEKCTLGEHPIGCYVSYEFVPGRKYVSSKYLLFYSSYSGKPEIKLANNDVPIILPSCGKDKNKCRFELTLDNIKSIARKYNLGDKSFRMVMFENRIVVEASYCDMNTMDNRKKIKIDPINGQVVWEGNNDECQGIF